MELDTLESEQQLLNRVNTSPFFMSSRMPESSPQPWELHDVDFLLSGPVTCTSRFFIQDSSRKNCTNVLESGISFSTELEDTTKPLILRSGPYWHDMSLNEPVPNELSTYLVDEFLPDKKVSAVPRSPPNIQVTPPTMLRVNTSACNDEELTAKRHSCSEDTLKSAVNAVSPTMVDKKILVTDNDLRLFSPDIMKALSGKKTPVKSSPRVQNRRKKAQRELSKTINSTFQIVDPVAQYKKRRASFDVIDEHVVHTLKRTKSANQQAWTAPSFDPRWYVGVTEGFHGMQPRLLSPINTSMSLEVNGANVYRRIQHPVDVQETQTQSSPPTRKIGIYSPADRRERLKRFHEKRKHRVYHKRIKYDCRKRLANSCPRVKGRFVRKSEYLRAKESDTTSSTTSESASNSEDCQL
ncbi:Zinc finger protein CONSTANS-LIKE 2 [Phytophthora citrophthora]|uniref:Zinc finger protein CONSTANS-LIKE 2 n=1 Tax=Phytophthora citrophthora TaxID=4793 RepID=A0AAD9GXT4_9STRA|nr:Zinc finger protein CONSTANS-LIKE 2 [Phytophthora citrophthora]